MSERPRWLRAGARIAFAIWMVIAAGSAACRSTAPKGTSVESPPRAKSCGEAKPARPAAGTPAEAFLEVPTCSSGHAPGRGGRKP
ncbi:MAG: hypothetical protein IT371_31360 [Deltaproteobacteria bacterium]|nr:hypothetical protein [Deltaproteobacteria bacterium]